MVYKVLAFKASLDGNLNRRRRLGVRWPWAQLITEMHKLPLKKNIGTGSGSVVQYCHLALPIELP